MTANSLYVAILLTSVSLGSCSQAKPMRFDDLKRCYAATMVAEAVLQKTNDKRGIIQISEARSDIARRAISAGKRHGWKREGVLITLRSEGKKEVEWELSNPHRSYQELLTEARKRQNECFSDK